jgi:NADPH:quinone reductase-like Zn-dependent oxidoreductase
MKGQYGVTKQLPTVPGWEGSGTVVVAGGGLAARFFLGRRVACAAPDRGDGAWADYMVTSAYRCLPLGRQVSDEQGAMMLVNPLSAWAMLDLARRGGHTAVVQTAAAGALGRMIFKLGRQAGMPVINIVRREEQVNLLKSMGALCVLNVNQPGFDDMLRELCREFKATMAFDAVAGEMTGRLLQAMPGRSEVIVYGALAGAACQLNPGQLIFKQQRVRGFWLSRWRPKFGLPGLLYAGWQVQNLLAHELQTEVQARLPLSEARAGLEMYVSGMSHGKVLFCPGAVAGGR